MTPSLLSSMVLAMGLCGQTPAMPDSAADLPRLTPGRTAALNSLWLENDPRARFDSAKQLTIAEIPGRPRSR